ncbi:ribonucleoside transporter [Citrobacter koseri]|uniref:Ribonucleoside transporter n=1 Tax=Citrobacter koseri TaxID=545 RepID=A0A447UN73_CITKO|nr:ribonucleoside transporter [Citrobacter koseri]VFS00365.1 ribonucleoside transporter [Citrobacter koseri]
MGVSFVGTSLSGSLMLLTALLVTVKVRIQTTR